MIQKKDSARGWVVVAAAFIGMLLSLGVVLIYSFGVLSSAMAADFGWTPAQRAGLFLSFSVSALPAGLIWGGIIDRIGGRSAAIISSALLAICFCLFAALPDDILLAHAVFVLVGVLGTGTLPATYVSVVVGWFERRRGLAIGITTMGVGVGAAIGPPIVAALVSTVGWRTGLLAIAAAIVIVGLPIMAVLMRLHPDAQPRRLRQEAAKVDGVGLAGTLRQRETWLLALFAIGSGMILVTMVTSFVPILQQRGLTLTEAAGYQSLVGISLIAGRAIVGGLIDRLFAPHVMVGIFLATSLGLFVFYGANSPLAYMVAALGIGLAMGAEIDFLGYMVSRYYPPAVFGRLFALMFAGYSLGGSIGPLAVVRLDEATGHQNIATLALALLACSMALLMFTLPRYDKELRPAR